jgi:hypothetical protein
VQLNASDVGALPSTYTPPNQTAQQVGADPVGTASSAVAGHNVDTASHEDIRLELKRIADQLTAFFDSDDKTLDELSEIVAYITSNKSLIDSITTSKVSVSDIVNNLTTNVSNKPLSAAQGVVLAGLINTLSNSLSGYQPVGDYALKSELPEVPVKSVNNKTGDVKVTASDVGADPAGTAANAVSAHNQSQEAHPDIRQELSRLSENIAALGTQEDIVQQVIAALGTPVFGRVDEDKNIVLSVSSPLAEGTYTLWLEDENGKVSKLCEYTNGGITDESGPIAITWNVGVKLDKNSGEEGSGAQYAASQSVPYASSYTYTIATTNDYHVQAAVCWYDASGNYLGWNDALTSGGSPGTNQSAVLTPKENAASFRIRAYSIHSSDPDRVNSLNRISLRKDLIAEDESA